MSGKKSPSTPASPRRRVFGRTRPGADGSLTLKRSEPDEVRDVHFRPLPKPTGEAPYHLDLKDVLGESEFAATYRPEDDSKVVFQLSGDTGSSPNSDNRAQLNVVDGMERQFGVKGYVNPAFFYSLGDCVYFNGQGSQYRAQFYEPYEHYPAPVFAVPGNHDGENLDGDGSTSLDAFVANFCAAHPEHLKVAGDIPRDAMTQPNVYWALLTPFARIIGLYTNVNPGGTVTQPQYDWLVDELKAAKADTKRAVLLTMHHPIYSLDAFHSGSPHVQEPVMKAIQASGRYPDMVLAGHVHNMQRFTVGTPDGPTPYIVAGAGGYNNLHKMQKEVKTTGTPFTIKDEDYGNDVTLESFVDDDHGFFRFEVTTTTILGEYYIVPRPQDPYARGPRLFERWTYDWKNRRFLQNAVSPIATPGHGY